MGSWKGSGNQYIQLVKVLYCKLSTNGKQLPASPLEVRMGTKPRSQRWEVRVWEAMLGKQWLNTINICIYIVLTLLGQ